jgi:hypothetical protein
MIWKRRKERYTFTADAFQVNYEVNPTDSSAVGKILFLWQEYG